MICNAVTRCSISLQNRAILSYKDAEEAICHSLILVKGVEPYESSDEARQVEDTNYKELWSMCSQTGTT
jgi:hypothetical protein